MQSLKRKVTSGILAAVIALTPIAPEVKVIADEVVPSETQVVETSSDNGTQTTDAVAPTTTTTVATEPAQTEPANEETPETTIEVTDPSDSIDTTAPPTEETTEATSDETDATTNEPTDTTPVESSDETSETTEATEPTESSDETSETSETSETTEPTETPTPTPTPVEITCATVCETQKEYNDFVNGISEEYWKIFVVTEDDLTDIVYDDARYYDGGYCFVFKTEEKFNTAVTYLTQNGYAFTKVEAVTSKIVIAKDMEEFISYIKEMSGAKLIINTTADISKDLKPDAGIYFDGTYVISFANQNDYIDAATYCANKGYEYSLDGDLSVCGDEDIPTVINFALNNDATTRVAVIDTGSDIANEYYCVLDGDDGVDRNGHGTRMVNNILTYTDNAYIISIKALKDNGHGDVSDVYNAIQMAKTMNVDYILLAMSLKDNGEYDAFKALIEECKAQGITVVASAGNNNKSASEYIPANCASVAVGAINSDGTKWALSNTGAAWYVMADSTSDAASLYIGYTLGNLPDYINAGYNTIGSTDANNTCGVEIEYAYTDNEGNEIDPVDFTVNYVVDPTISESGGNVTVKVKIYNTVLGVGESIVSYGTAGNGRTAEQARALATQNANEAAGADVTRQMPSHQSEHSSAVNTVVSVLSGVGLGSTKSTTTHDSTDYHNGSSQNSTEVWIHTQRVYSSSTTVTWTVSIGDGDVPTNSAAYQILKDLYAKGNVRIGYNTGNHETIHINFAEVADTISDKMISYRRGAGYAVRTGDNGLFAGSGKGHSEEGGHGYCAAPAKGHTHYKDLSITDTIRGYGLVGTPYTNYNKSMPDVGYFKFNGTCRTVAMILGSDYSQARKQAWVWSHAGWNVTVSGGVPSDTPPSYSAQTRQITSADGAKVAPYAQGWDNGVVRMNLVPQGNYPKNADGAYLLIPNQEYKFDDTNKYISYMSGSTYVDNNSGLVYSVNGNTLTVKLDPSKVTNWANLATGDAHLNFSRNNVAISSSDSFHNNMKQWEDWKVYIYGTKQADGDYDYYSNAYQEHLRGVYDLYTAQWDMRGNIEFYTNLYVYVAKESADSRSYNNCYSMEGVTFRMEGNNKVYQFTQPMGQTGGQTQAIKLTADDMAALVWNVYENDGTLPVRTFNGVERNSGYLYDFSKHPVNYADAYYDPTFPVQGGGVADDGAVIKVLVQDVPDGDPLNQYVKKEDEEGWDETNAPSAATTDGIEFTVYYYADYFYDADSMATNFMNYTDSVALYNYQEAHKNNPTLTAKITLSGQGTKKYGMFELDGDTFPVFSPDGTSNLRYGTYIVQETGTNNSYYLNSTPLFGTVISQKVNGKDSGIEQREYYFYNNETNNGPMGNTLYVKQYPKQTADAQCIVFNDKVIYGYACLDKTITQPTGVNEPIYGYEQGTSMEDTVYGIYSQSENKLYAVVILNEDGTMKSVTYPKDIKPDPNVAPTVRLVGGKQYFRLPTGNFYATEIRPSDTNDVRNNGTYPDGSTNSGEVITAFVGQTVNQSMFYMGHEYNFTSGVQGQKLNFTVITCHELDVLAGEQPNDDEIVDVHAEDIYANAEFDFNLDKVGYNGWKYYGAEFSIYTDEACTDANKVMTLTDNNDGHYVSTQANNIRDYLTYSPTSYTVASSGDLLFNYDVTVYFKETVAPTQLVNPNGGVWNIPEQNRADIMDGAVYRVDIALHDVSQSSHIGTLTYTISGGHIQSPISFTITNYNAHESHNHADNGTVSEIKNIKLANDFDSKMYEDSMSLALLKTTDTPYLDINNNGRDDSTDYHFDIRTTWFFVTSGPLDGGYPTFSMVEMRNAKKEGRNLLKEYLLTQTNLIGYYDFGADQWYDSAQQPLPDGWERLYGLQYDKTYYIYEVFEVPEYAYDNDNDPNPPGQNGVYDIAGEIFQIVTNQNGATSRENTERVYSSIPYPNLATGTYSEWEQSSYFNTMWEMHFDTPEFTVFKMNANESSITYDANNHLMYGDIDLNKVWSEDNTDGRQDLAGYEFLFEYGGNLDKAYWDMDDSEMAAIGMGSYSEIPHTYIIRLTDVNGNIHLEDVPAGWYRISENTNNMEVRFHSDRGADQQARATIKLVDGTEEVFYVVNIMDTPIYVNKFDTWTSEPIVIDPFTGERRAYEGDYSLRFELYTDANKDGQITGAEWDNVRVIVDRSHSGLVAFNGLKSGQYAAREVITADGYYLDTGFRFVTIYDLDNSGSITDDIFEIKLYNEPYSAPITIEKYIDPVTKKPVTDAEFTIYYDNGSVEGEWDEQDERAMTWEPQLDANGNQMYEQIKLGYYDVDGVWHDQVDADGNPIYVDGKPLGTYRYAEVWYDSALGKYVSDPLRAYHTWNSTTGKFEHRNYVVVESKLPYGLSFGDDSGEPTVKPVQQIFAIEYPDMQADEGGTPGFVYRDGHIDPIENTVEVTVQNFVKYNPEIEITTEALSLYNGNHTLEVGTIVSLNDTVNYHNLAPTGRYTFRAELRAKDDIDTIIATTSKSFTATAKDGSEVVTFVDVNTAKLVEGIENADGTVTYKAKDLVVYVYCDWDSDFDIYDGERASHCDPNDVKETVTVENPTVTTTFVDTTSGTHLAPIGENVPMQDTVKINQLNPNETYYAEAILMNAKTGKALVDRDTNNPYTNRVSFVPTVENHNDCSVVVPFNVDTVDFVEYDVDTGKLTTVDIVCFERIYASDGTLIASHEDLTDENQTVTVIPPTLHTTLVDVASNSHDGSFGTSITLRDKVDYEFASAGTEYTIRGQLWKVNADGSIEKLLDGDKDVTFTAEGRNGTQYVTFSNIDSTKLCENGKPIKVVCFEYMFCTAMVDDDKDNNTPMVEKEIQISSHEDVTDQNQTVEFKPTCETTLLVAKGENDGDNFDNKLLLDNKVQTLSDTVKVNDLIVNENYTVVGHLVDQETGAQLYRNEGGEELTTTLPFTADKADMEIVVDFKDVDTSTFGFYKLNEATGELEWTKPNQVVCFEELVSTTGFVFSLHHDLTDENQTVHRPHYLRVSIAKMDADNVKYYLSGAEITIYTGDGKVALDVNGNECVGLTDDNGHIEFEIRYVEGQTYYAKETKAPAGYNLNEDKFQIKPVDAKGYGKEEIIPISIFDRIIIIPPHPKTGDSTPVMALIALIIVGAVGLTTLFIFKGKKKGQVEGNTSIEGVSNENPENDQN